MKKLFAFITLVFGLAGSPSAKAEMDYTWYLRSSDLGYNYIYGTSWDTSPDVWPMDWWTSVYCTQNCSGTKYYSRRDMFTRNGVTTLQGVCSVGTTKKAIVIFNNYGAWDNSVGFYVYSWDNQYSIFRTSLISPPDGSNWSVYVISYTRYSSGACGISSMLVDVSYSNEPTPTSVANYEQYAQ